MHMTERGGTAEAMTMIAFGGAGPVHAYNMARKIGIGQLLVPLRAGVLSALGLLIAPPAYDLVRTLRVNLYALDSSVIEANYAAMEREIEQVLREVQPNGEMRFTRSADVGYVGQGYQVNVPIDDLGPSPGDHLWRTFGDIYRAKYGYFYDDVPAEVVNLRVNGQMLGGQFKPEQQELLGDIDDCRTGTRAAFSASLGKVLDFAVYDRSRFGAGMTLEGPALVEEVSSTTIVDAGGWLKVDDHGSLVIRIGSPLMSGSLESGRAT
jgi:N-methylhydantoinase A/oxoprolinase/acetone carboxylase beta subunit